MSHIAPGPELEQLQLRNLIRDRLPMFVGAVQAKINEYWSGSFKNLTPPTMSSMPGGVKYARVVQEDGSQRCVYCFVDLSNGNVLKAAGWAKPAKHARSNILDEDLGISGVGPYGANYL